MTMHAPGARHIEQSCPLAESKRTAWESRWHVVLGVMVTLGLGWVANVSSQTGSSTPPVSFQLDPIVVTSTVLPAPLSQTTASITVLSQEQIAAQQASSVIELLRQVPGLHIDQAGARGSVSSVYLRGGDPNFTTVLIDGIKVNDPTNSRGGSFDFSTLNTDAIERIEIVRGPLSAVYGSDAMSGVINIITRRGEPEAVRSVEAAGGRFGYVRTQMQARGMLGPMDYALSGSYLDNGEPVEGSGFINKTFHLNSGLPVAEHLDLRWVLRYADSDSTAFPDDSGGPKFAVRRDVDKRQAQELTLGLSLVHEPLPWWEHTFQVSLYHRREDMSSPGVEGGIRDPLGLPPSTSDNIFQRVELTWIHRFTVIKGVRLAVGAQAQFEEGVSTGILDLRALGGDLTPTDFRLSRDIWAPFFEVQLSPLPGLLVQGGVRVDLPQRFDYEVSPRVGVSYTVAATDTTLRANWGEGFKLPSFFSLGHPLVGNPTLVPETSRSVDAGVTQALWGKRLTVGVTYFYQTFYNLIDFEENPALCPPPGLFPCLVNRDKVTSEGVEASVQLQPWSSLNVHAHLTYVKTDIKGTAEELRNRPKWRGGFTVWWRPVPALDMYLHTLFVGEVPDSSIPTGDRKLDAYTRVDLAATWTFASTWKLFLAVDNLFDADYEEAVGFPAPGISPRGGVQARF